MGVVTIATSFVGPDLMILSRVAGATALIFRDQTPGIS